MKFNINVDDFKNYALKYFKKNKEELVNKINEMKNIEGNFTDKDFENFIHFKEGIKLIIDINSPFFDDIIYNTDIFNELFVLPIDTKLIEEYKIKNEYISTFNKLNDLNLNYSSLLFIFKDSKDSNYLKDFNIQFNQIKNFKIYQNAAIPNFDYNFFFKDLFSLKNIEINIIDLQITIKKEFGTEIEIDENILKNLNNFKVLENLTLSGLTSKNIFELKIKSLKYLNINSCKKIYINADEELSLKTLKINIDDKNSNSLLKLPQL